MFILNRQVETPFAEFDLKKVVSVFLPYLSKTFGPMARVRLYLLSFQLKIFALATCKTKSARSRRSLT